MAAPTLIVEDDDAQQTVLKAARERRPNGRQSDPG